MGPTCSAHISLVVQMTSLSSYSMNYGVCLSAGVAVHKLDLVFFYILLQPMYAKAGSWVALL
ncbi:hypothetical protein BJX76DRAFT_320458 [Aspergillus varians]